jgi:ArsR family transcriptional regulator
VVVVDMLPHHHEEYRQQMGHVWLGFSETQMVKLLTGAGFEEVRTRSLPLDPDAKGPALFVATGTRELGS